MSGKFDILTSTDTQRAHSQVTYALQVMGRSRVGGGGCRGLHVGVGGGRLYNKG